MASKKKKTKNVNLQESKVIDIINQYIPVIMIGFAILVIIFQWKGIINNQSSSFMVGIIINLLLIYTAVMSMLTKKRVKKILITLSIFTLLWLLSIGIGFYTSVYFGEQVANLSLNKSDKPHPISLNGKGKNFDVIVKGGFESKEQSVNREGKYDIVIEGQNESYNISGEFEERWSQNRTRRGFYRTSHLEHLVNMHNLKVNNEGDYTLRLEKLSETIVEPIKVYIYKKHFPTVTLSIFYPILILASIVIDASYSESKKQGYLATLTSVTVGFIYALRVTALPEVSISTLLISILIGGILGGGVGLLLFYSLKSYVKKLLPLPLRP